jgi:hypothetical protein
MKSDKLGLQFAGIILLVSLAFYRKRNNSDSNRNNPS